MKIKLDPKKVQIDELTQLQVEEIVTGWVKYLNKVLAANTDKVCMKINDKRFLFAHQIYHRYSQQQKNRNLQNTPL